MESTNTKRVQHPVATPAAVMAQAALGTPKRKRDRSAKEQALIFAATKLFAERGYEATTTREIAAEAGCAEGLIHRYFKGKSGLFLALIQVRVSREIADLDQRLPLAENLEDEILQLLNWKIDRMWEDEQFLRVVIPTAMLDPAIGKVLGRVVNSKTGAIVVQRLQQFQECQHLPDEEVEALVRLIDTAGFSFGFLRPVILGQDRVSARNAAPTIAKLLARTAQRNHPQLKFHIS